MFIKGNLIDGVVRLAYPATLRGNADETASLRKLKSRQVALEMQVENLQEANRQLQSERDKYAGLYNSAPVGFVMLGEKYLITEINRTASKMLGCMFGSLSCAAFPLDIFQDGGFLFQQHVNHVLHGHGQIAAEFKIRHALGSPRILRFNFLAVDDYNCRITLLDITEQEALAGTVRKMDSEIQALLNTIPAAVYIKDRQLRYVSVNSRFEKVTGQRFEDIIGRTDGDVLPQEMAAKLKEIDQDVLVYGKSFFNLEQHFTGPQGERYWMSISKAPYFDANGKIAGIVGVSVDISAIKLAEKRDHALLLENRHLTSELFKKHEIERQRLAVELHDELGQWLIAIQAEAHAISNSEVSEQYPVIHDSARAINRSADEVNSMIRRMARSLRPAMLDRLGLSACLQELVEQWNGRGYGMRFELLMWDELDDVDERCGITVYRLIQESFNNALKHSDADTVFVVIRKLEQDGMLSLWIEDDGQGVDIAARPPEGIGLLGMRERVVSAGGTFEFCSAPGCGFRIDAHLPLRSGEK